MSYQYDFIVVGAGIAGIAIAELLQRSGKKVLLLEAESKLASLHHHNIKAGFTLEGFMQFFLLQRLLSHL